MLRLGKGFETSRVVRSLVKHGYKMDFVNQPKLTGPEGNVVLSIDKEWYKWV